VRLTSIAVLTQHLSAFSKNSTLLQDLVNTLAELRERVPGMVGQVPVGLQLFEASFTLFQGFEDRIFLRHGPPVRLRHTRTNLANSPVDLC
jgi:hypothetical protein